MASTGADGVRSTCRDFLYKFCDFGQPEQPIFSGQVAYRQVSPPRQLASPIPTGPQVIPRSLIRKHSIEAEEFFFAPNSPGITCRGPFRHLLTFPVGHDGRLLNVVGFIPEDRAEDESWTATGTVTALRHELEGWCQPVQSLIDAIEEVNPEMLKQALYYRSPLKG